MFIWGFPCGSVVKTSSASAGGSREVGSIPGLGSSLGGGNGHSLVFLCGKSHGQRSLVGYNPWGCKELNVTERLSTSKHIAIPFSWGSSQPRDWTRASRIAGKFFTVWATREALYINICKTDIIYIKWKAQSCPSLCYLMDYIVHGILQARILEWVAFPSTKGSS